MMINLKKKHLFQALQGHEKNSNDHVLSFYSSKDIWIQK